MSSTKLAFTSVPAVGLAAPTFLSGQEAEKLEQEIHEKIGERARLLFEQSGGAPGNDEANWFRAEKEILRPGLQVSESGSWFALTASVPDAGPSMQILVKPRRVILCAGRRSEDQEKYAGGRTSGQDKVFLAADLAADVDPSTAVASFRSHILRLMIKKTEPGK
jgi:HSP20 family molecular chaperone IbpA